MVYFASGVSLIVTQRKYRTAGLLVSVCTFAYSGGQCIVCLNISASIWTLVSIVIPWLCGFLTFTEPFGKRIPILSTESFRNCSRQIYHLTMNTWIWQRKHMPIFKAYLLKPTVCLQRVSKRNPNQPITFSFLRAITSLLTVYCTGNGRWENGYTIASASEIKSFLWWEGDQLNGNLVEYQITSHSFGMTPSPFCAKFALRRTAVDWEIGMLNMSPERCELNLRWRLPCASANWR